MKNYNQLEIEKSILLMQKEQIVILSKEIANLHLIVEYNIKYIEHSEQKKHFSNLLIGFKQRLKNLSNRIKINYDILEDVLKPSINDDIQKEKNVYIPRYRLEVLLFIVLNRKRLERYLDTLYLINMRLQQMINNAFYLNSYRPVISKRYSNANLIPLYEKSFQKRMLEFETLSEKAKKNITFTWDFENSYYIDIDQDNINFSMSYWNFDIPIISNTIFTHELGHLFLKEIKSNKKSNEILKFEKKINNNLTKVFKKHSEFHNDIEEWDNEDFTEEIISDIFALCYHGTSYLLSFFHLSFAENIIFQDESDIENYQYGYFPAEWVYDFDRDKLFLRLAFLVVSCEILYLNNNLAQEKFINKFDDVNVIEQIKQSLELIYPIFNLKSAKDEYGFYQAYDRFKNINDGYIHSYNLTKDIFEKISNVLKKNLVLTYQNSFESDFIKTPLQPYTPIEERKNFPFFANDLWFSWFDANKNNQIAQKIFYRKKIHKETIYSLMKKQLYDKQQDTTVSSRLLDIKEVKPYKMTLLKGIYEQRKHNPKKILKHTLGFYDMFFLEELDEKFEPEFKTIREEQYSIRTNHALFQILTPIKGDNPSNPNLPSCIIQIDVKKSDETINIYQNLYQSINVVYNTINEYKKEFNICQVFKTLGPSDLIIFLQYINIETIYEIKKRFKNTDCSTLTTILYDNDLTINHCCQDNLFFFQTDIVGKLTDNEIVKIKKKATVHFSSGIYDYTIIWHNQRLAEIYSILNNCQSIIEKNTYIKYEISQN